MTNQLCQQPVASDPPGNGSLLGSSQLPEIPGSSPVNATPLMTLFYVFHSIPNLATLTQRLPEGKVLCVTHTCVGFGQ